MSNKRANGSQIETLNKCINTHIKPFLFCKENFAEKSSSLFQHVKEPILHGNSACFALQNRHYCIVKQSVSLFTCVFLYKQKGFYGHTIKGAKVA